MTSFASVQTAECISSKPIRVTRPGETNFVAVTHALSILKTTKTIHPNKTTILTVAVIGEKTNALPGDGTEDIDFVDLNTNQHTV
jgi:hypothetical protein